MNTQYYLKKFWYVLPLSLEINILAFRNLLTNEQELIIKALANHGRQLIILFTYQAGDGDHLSPRLTNKTNTRQ